MTGWVAVRPSALLVGALIGVGILLWTWPRRLRPLGGAGPRVPVRALRRAIDARFGRTVKPGEEPAILAAAEALAGALAAGLDVGTAHQLVAARLVPELAPREGETAAQAWRRVGETSPGALAVGCALDVSARLGSPAHGAVRAAVRGARERLAQAGAVDGAVAGARATGRLLSLLPLCGPLAVLGLGLDPRTTYGQPGAAVCCLAGLALTGLGSCWVRRQVRQAAREEAVG